jgi:hypothetical protein
MKDFRTYLEEAANIRRYNEGMLSNIANKLKGNKKENVSSFSLDDNDKDRIEKMEENYKSFYNNFINKLKTDEKTKELYNTNPGVLGAALIKAGFLNENDYDLLRKILTSEGNLTKILQEVFPNEYLKKTSTASLVTKLNDVIKAIHMPKFGTDIESFNLTKGTSL